MTKIACGVWSNERTHRETACIQVADVSELPHGSSEGFQASDVLGRKYEEDRCRGAQEVSRRFRRGEFFKREPCIEDQIPTEDIVSAGPGGRRRWL